MNVYNPAAESMANMDRVYWVTVVRPQLIASGNLIETQAMKDEAEAIRRQVERSGKPVTPPVVPTPAPVRTPSGDWVPAPPPPVVDFKARASGEKDDEPVDSDVPF